MFEVTSQPFGTSTSDELTLSGNSTFLESRNKSSKSSSGILSNTSFGISHCWIGALFWEELEDRF
jgi:hypothetical protein